MPSNISRRSVAKGVAWTVPAVMTTVAAPAMAASCTPTTVTKASALTWTSTQTSFTSQNGDPEFHTVQYTVTNTGPDPMVAGPEIDIALTIPVLQGEEVTVEVVSTTSNASATVTNTSTSDDDAGTTTDNAVVKVVTTDVIPVNGTFEVVVKATYGALADDVKESVTAQSPYTVTDAATCVTTVATVTTSGSSDGTSYTSPG